MAHEQNGMAKLGEISTIRDILMGQQMSEYESRFAQLEAYLKEAEQLLQQKIATLSGDSSTQLSALEEQTQQRFAKLENTINDQFNEFENATTNRFSQLEKLLLDNVEHLNEEIDKTSRTERQRIGKLLMDMGSQLMEE